MAVLAPQDWHPPRDHTMDVPSPNNANPPSIPRQRSSPSSGEHSPSIQQPPPQQQPQQQQQQQQPYPYPVQQQQPQGGWTPSISAQPFYPSFYQSPHQQQSYQLHGHPSQSPVQQQNPYFDPAANAQLAQWAYQTMMFNAQQAHQLSHIPPHLAQTQQQRNPPGQPPGGPDYFAQNQVPSPFNSFPSGTPPPPHPHNFSNGQRDHQGSQQQSQYGGYHPYRRPGRQGSSHTSDGDWRSGGPPGPFQPPYARPDASGSTSSVNSTSSHSGARQRTNSTQGSSSGGSIHNAPSGHSSSGSVRNRNGVSQSSPSVNTGSVRSRSGSAGASSQSAAVPQRPHNRNGSSSSSSSSAPRTSSASMAPRPSIASSSTSSSTSHGKPVARPAKPSPLSQGTFTAAEKRMSKDDSDLAAMLEPAPSASMLRSGGLKGRLRRALSFNAASTLREEEDVDDAVARAPGASSSSAGPSASHRAGNPISPDSADASDAASTATVQTKKKSRAASLFNSRLNASTDNISLSSTVSSASVMIRKLGSMGKLARRNSLAGITSLFKDKKEKDGDDSKKDKKDKKKSSKGDAAEASISHVTAELDRSSNGDWNASAEMSGLSPAAKLARQHTLKSNAEADARAKAKAQMEAAAASQSQPSNGTPVPATWERNTATRAEQSPVKAGGAARVNEDGTKVFVEDDDSGSEEGTVEGHTETVEQSYSMEGWDDDEDWGEGEDEDVTIRVGLERTSIGDEMEEPEPWAVDIRRSIERERKPARGILKHSGSYDQHDYLLQHPNPARGRSNSYNSHPGQAELGPLARIPSPDPDHIDGLHRHPSHSSAHSHHIATSSAPFLAPLPFESSGGFGIDSPKESDSGSLASPHVEKSIFNHPTLNSSAPALSTALSSPPPSLTHRSATVPAKRLAFASNLSVYDTFPPSVYDRRSEPATWSRLTPVLAQRIKEELNSYKMEEMEVHAASRIHTQFFV